jgi:predicted secreted protein
MIKFKSVILFFLIVLSQSTLYDIIYAFDKFTDQEMIIVHKEQNGKDITVKSTALIQIELAELGSAGYTWHINNLDSQYVELISEKTRKVSKEGKLSAPVMRVWRFKAKKAGRTEIKMDYYRNWEGVKKSQDYFFIRIKII